MDATSATDRGRSGTLGGPPTLVLGGSGLLGSATRRALATTRTPAITARIPWTESSAAVEALLEAVDNLPDAGWWLAWCAGSGVIATPPEEIEQELAVLREFLSRWRPSSGTPGSRALFFASSAGGVYAGSAAPPFTESTVPRPLSPYGRAKLEAERIFADFAREAGIPLLIGRISTLFGPDQDLDKPQGLVSQLCKAHATGKPLSLYVPLDTMRDYLYADDAGAMVVRGLRAVAEAGVPGPHLKLFVGGRSVTVNEVVGEVRRVSRHRPPVVTQPSSVARFHVADLRMRSTAWPDLGGARTPFGAGIGACLAAVNAHLRAPHQENRPAAGHLS